MSTKTLDAISGLVVLIGLAEGVMPFVAKATGWTPFWALPRHLDAPAWWIVSGAVIASVIVAITILEHLKRRAEKQ